MVEPMTEDPRLVAVPAPKKGRRMPASMYLAVICGLLATIGVLIALRGPDQVQAAVAARALVSGEIVHEGDFRYVEMSAAGPVAETLLKPADVAAMSGRQSTRNIPEGGLVTRADLVEFGVTPVLRAMSVPIDPTRAAGGTLTRGDLVDVIDSSTGTAVYVAAGAKVLEVGDSTGSKLGASGHYAVTVAIDDTTALRVAAAITAGKVDVVRSTGSAPVLPGSPPTTVRR